MKWMVRIAVVPVWFWTGTPLWGLPSSAPRLIVVLSIDQFRADFLTRFQEHYLPPRRGDLPGGFRLLTEEGADYRNARYAHLCTLTGPGHATILTGAPPSRSGIVGNRWFDREEGRKVGCVEDPGDRPVGGGGVAATPGRLLVTTVGDELKMATAGVGKVVGISYKDRSAIFLAGHLADTALWFHDSTGRWISSAHYCKSGRLPAWAGALNREKPVDKYFGRQWMRLLPPGAYARTVPVPEDAFVDLGHLGARFPHPLEGDGKVGPDFYLAFAGSGFGNDFLFETARRAVEAEGLGVDEAPDLLAVGLSTNDFVGHRYGPNSPEILDVSVRTDRALADFLKFLFERVGRDHLVVVLTGDHGVAPVPEEVAGPGGPGGRLNGSDLETAVDKELDRFFGESEWVSAFTAPSLYLNREATRSSGKGPEELEKAAAAAARKIPGIHAAFTRSQILEGRLPRTDLGAKVYNAFHPRRSGDVLVVPEPNWVWGESVAATHGQPYPYDAHVPLVIWGKGVRGGKFFRRVTPMDIAPTLSQLLGIEYPSGCVGDPLREALEP